MREIKFRAWHEYGKSIKDPVEPGMVYDINPGDCLHWKSQGQKITDVMQYTGLKDKTGKEIYEGDIVEPAGGAIKEVVYIADCWGSGFQLRKSDGQLFSMIDISKFMVVIGNIHENMDLLSTDKKE